MSDGLIITGSSGNDSIFGSNDNDILIGLGGDDTITAGDGNDLIYCGEGNDFVLGGEGIDIVISGHRYRDISNESQNQYDLTLDLEYTGIDNIDTGLGNDFLIVGNITDGSSYNGGEGFDVISINSNTISQSSTIEGFEVWNFTGNSTK